MGAGGLAIEVAEDPLDVAVVELAERLGIMKRRLQQYRVRLVGLLAGEVLGREI